MKIFNACFIMVFAALLILTSIAMAYNLPKNNTRTNNFLESTLYSSTNQIYQGKKRRNGSQFYINYNKRNNNIGKNIYSDFNIVTKSSHNEKNIITTLARKRIKRGCFDFLFNIFKGCNEDSVKTNKYVGNEIHSYYTKCDDLVMVKQWVNIAMESYLSAERCFDLYRNVIPLGHNSVFFRKNFQPKIISIDYYNFNYNIMIQYLNDVIKFKYKNLYTLNNYIKACQSNSFCYKNANRTNKTIETLLKEYSEMRKEKILDFYITNNQRSTRYGMWRDFFIQSKKTHDIKFDEIDRHVVFEKISYNDYLIQLKKKVCTDFSNDYGFIFAIFDEYNIVLTPYVRSLIINNLSQKADRHFNIFDYYKQADFLAIFYYIPPVKKCIGKYCVVLVPSKIKYTVDGCSEIFYNIFNGIKFDSSPEIEIVGDNYEVSKHYYENISKIQKSGIHLSALFTVQFKASIIYNALIKDINDDIMKKFEHCIEWKPNKNTAIITRDNILNNTRAKFHGFHVKKECLNDNQTGQDYYENFFLYE